MAVAAVGFLLRLPDVDGLREFGTVLLVIGAVVQGGFFLYLGSYKRWNDPPSERRARHRRAFETPPRDF